MEIFAWIIVLQNNMNATKLHHKEKLLFVQYAIKEFHIVQQKMKIWSGKNILLMNVLNNKLKNKHVQFVKLK